MKKFAVLGRPITHSKSPQIHRYFAENSGKSLSYEKILVPEEAGFIATITRFQQQGGAGVNVTAPCKEHAFHWVSTLTERARLAAAVNTIALNADGTSLGDNTDGVGFIRDIKEFQGWPLRHKRILILGAGGATRGILHPLLLEQPLLVTIANRTKHKAQSLAESFKRFGAVIGIGFDECALQSFDMIINALPRDSFFPPLSTVLTDTRCYDLTYGDEMTPFLQRVRAAGATEVVDGLGMLIEQAAESFYVWHDIRPDTKKVRDLLQETNHG